MDVCSIVPRACATDNSPMNKTQKIKAEDLQGGENTNFGEVAHIIAELDGIDVVFVNGDVSHFDYGDTLELI